MAEKRTRIRFPGQRRYVRSQQDVSHPTFPREVTPAKPRWIKYGLRIPMVGTTPADYYLAVAPLDTQTTSQLERLVFGWLVRQHIPFAYQVNVLGGRQVPGGAVLDFVVYLRQPPTVLRIMGAYMHRQPTQAYNDMIQRTVLEDMGYIVIDLWEEDITDMVLFETTMDRIIYGGQQVATR